MNNDTSLDFFRREDGYKQLAESIVKQSVKKGADQSDVFLQWGQKTDVRVRLGGTESIKQASSKGLGLRVFKKGRLGFASTTDFSAESTKILVNRACELAEISGVDEFYGLPEQAVQTIPELDIFDGTCLNMDTGLKIELAREMEAAAMDVDKRISNSEGAVFHDACSGTIIANSSGELLSFYKTNYFMHCEPVAQVGEERRVNYWYSSAPHFKRLEKGTDIGRKAGERVIRMLGAKKTGTQKLPVVFDPLIASGFIGNVMSCVDGEKLNKKETCFWDKQGVLVASELVMVIDHGDMPGHVGSLPFDGEGVPSPRKLIIDKGRLTAFLYDTYSARKGRTMSTGNGLRSYNSLPVIHGTNFFLNKGESTPDSIIKSVGKGLYVTGLIGFGVNVVNGNYSRGAEGLMIEDGELTYPVHEVTISGNILDMLKNIEAVGDDLVLRSAASAPTILIGEMVVSGM